MTLPTPLIPMPTLNPNATPFDQIFGLAHIDAQSSRKGGDVLQFHHRFTFAHVVLAALERYFEFEAAAGGRATTVVVATVVVAMHQCLQHLLRHRPTRQDGVRPRKRTVSVNRSINREKKKNTKKRNDSPVQPLGEGRLWFHQPQGHQTLTERHCPSSVVVQRMWQDLFERMET